MSFYLTDVAALARLFSVEPIIQNDDFRLIFARLNNTGKRLLRLPVLRSEHARCFYAGTYERRPGCKGAIAGAALVATMPH